MELALLFLVLACLHPFSSGQVIDQPVPFRFVNLSKRGVTMFCNGPAATKQNATEIEGVPVPKALRQFATEIEGGQFQEHKLNWPHLEEFQCTYYSYDANNTFVITDAPLYKPGKCNPGCTWAISIKGLHFVENGFMSLTHKWAHDKRLTH